MKIGIIVDTNGPELVWNAFGLENSSLKQNHSVKVFFTDKGAEAECIKEQKFNTTEQLHLFVKNKGEILACGTSLENKQKEGSAFCPISIINDLLGVVEESDKVLTFG